MVMEPLGALLPNNATIVSIVVARHVMEDVMHSLGRNVGKKRSYEMLMRQIGKVYEAFCEYISRAILQLQTHELCRPTMRQPAARKIFDGP